MRHARQITLVLQDRDTGKPAELDIATMQELLAQKPLISHTVSQALYTFCLNAASEICCASGKRLRMCSNVFSMSTSSALETTP